MKYLLCMRHAKSDWSQDLSDLHRPLNKRGRRAAPRMAQVLVDKGWAPDKALISTAERTQETFRLMKPIFTNANIHMDIQNHSEMYLTGLGVVQTIVERQVQANTLLLIGHNPGWSTMVSRLSGQTIDMTTANVVILSSSNSSWSDAIRTMNWTVLEHLLPREL